MVINGDGSDIKEDENHEIIEPENIDDWEWRVETAETTTNPEYIGTITLLNYKGTATEIVIPNHINGIPVKAIGKESEYADDTNPYCLLDESLLDSSILVNPSVGIEVPCNTTITKVKISWGIEVIKPTAFYGFLGLKEIIIPSSVIEIGSWAFYYTTPSYYYIPSSVQKIGEGAFNCSPNSIYCGAKQKPSGWVEGWGPYEKFIYWGSKRSDISLTNSL